jgi:hypothetical protein
MRIAAPKAQARWIQSLARQNLLPPLRVARMQQGKAQQLGDLSPDYSSGRVAAMILAA